VVDLLPRQTMDASSLAADQISGRLLVSLLLLWLIFAAVWTAVVVTHTSPVSSGTNAAVHAADAQPKPAQPSD